MGFALTLSVCGGGRWTKLGQRAEKKCQQDDGGRQTEEQRGNRKGASKKKKKRGGKKIQSCVRRTVCWTRSPQSCEKQTGPKKVVQKVVQKVVPVLKKKCNPKRNFLLQRCQKVAKSGAVHEDAFLKSVLEASIVHTCSILREVTFTLEMCGFFQESL